MNKRLKRTCLFSLFFFYFTANMYCAVGSSISGYSNEGIKIRFCITEEPTKYAAGKVSIGKEGTGACIDVNVEGEITIPGTIKDGNNTYYVTSVAKSAFSGCNKTTSIILPYGITTIGENAFHSCRSLSYIYISENVKSLGKNAFAYCSSLESIILPNSITSIEEGCFQGCNHLSSFSFDNIYYIYKDAFKDCIALETITFEKDVSLKENAFRDCTSLSSVSFKQGAHSIQKYAFSGCTNLNSVYWESESTAGVDYYGFDGINSEATLYVPSEDRAKYDTGDGVTWKWPFKHIRKMPLTIGDTTNLCFSSECGNIDFVGEVIDCNPLRIQINSILSESIGERLSIPTEIVGYDDIPLEITGISEGAFKQENITKLYFSEGLQFIQNNAFDGCNNITYVSFPRSLLKIGDIFSNYGELDSVSVSWRDPSKIEISEQCFRNIQNKAVLYVPAGTKKTYKDHSIWGRFSIIQERTPIYAGDISVCSSSSQRLPIFLNNAVDILGLQFKLRLPKGVTIKESDGDIAAYVSERTDKFTIMAKNDPDEEGCFLFVVFSWDGSLINDSEGVIMNIRLDISNNIELGVHDIKIEDIYMTTSTFETINPAESTSELTVKNYISGDVNNDGIINVTDAIGIVNYVLKNRPETFIDGAADVNEDGIINVTDAIGIVNKIF